MKGEPITIEIPLTPRTKKRPRAHFPASKIRPIRNLATRHDISDEEFRKILHRSLLFHSPSGDYEKELAWEIRKALTESGNGAKFFSGPITILTEYEIEKKKIRITIVPLNVSDPIPAGDGDNLDKSVWDSLQKAGLIHDDRQIVRWSGQKI